MDERPVSDPLLHQRYASEKARRVRRREAGERTLYIRIPADVRAAIDQRVEASGLSLTRYALASMQAGMPPAPLRRAALPAADRELLTRLLYQLQKAGTNLNQLVHLKHTEAVSERTDATAVVAALNQVRELADDIRALIT